MREEIIKQEHIITGIQVANWEEAIQASGDLLIKSGAVSTEYVKQMIQSVKDNGPYIVIGPGIAMAHARPSEAVRENAISLAVLKEAVSFGHEENDPVDLVFSFSAKEADSHLKMMESLSRVLIDEQKVEQLRQAKTAKEIYQLL
ncbi:PTS sugar transporter subunit IIA [Pontibacillus litoralis]|uniref:Ascorbate-specific PTS system EIIA component n=1 Tax=Pontibacillus litoralis JSM 072002 TaxID=1385512 RepID=A0A0A5G4S4_9BACI|nr:PTS sugar transporter subunit IIA [Pontibacillus litoralis]KGX86075.1 PTS mannitol transporter subunit IIA [Pontibacillus litoralis JSM 072002]